MVGIIWLNVTACLKLIESDGHWAFVVVDAVAVALGLFSFLYTVLANPGIPDEIFRKMAALAPYHSFIGFEE